MVPGLGSSSFEMVEKRFGTGDGIWAIRFLDDLMNVSQIQNIKKS
jgi:hypothetical protein